VQLGHLFFLFWWFSVEIFMVLTGSFGTSFGPGINLEQTTSSVGFLFGLLHAPEVEHTIEQAESRVISG
jgi:hypothetical protein